MAPLPDKGQTPRGRGTEAQTGRRWSALWPVLGLAVLVLVIAVVEGDLSEEFTDFTTRVADLLRRYGAAAALALLYIEESGVPLPVPGDVYVVYLGSLAHGSALRWIAIWLAIVVVVVGGASNLYLISRRWGSRLLEHRLAAVFHLERERVEHARAWFDRWGPLVIIFGRHVPGMRIPITVVSGTLKVRYGHFAPSVAVSTAVWAGFWLWLGASFGRTAISFLGGHRWLYLILVAAVAIVLGLFGLRLYRLGTQAGSIGSGQA